MEYNKVYITEICEDVLDNYFPQIDSLSQLLTTDAKRGSRIIVNKVKRILQSFEEYCPMSASQIINPDSKGYYEFTNNYAECLEGKKPWTDLELVPLTIAKLGGSRTNSIGRLAATANYWTYEAPVLHTFSGSSVVQIDAYYHYPIVINYTDDGYLNKYSHIFGFDEKTKFMFFNLCELQILEMIKGNENRVQFPTTIQFFNLDEDIQRLRELVDEDRAASASLKLGWR